MKSKVRELEALNKRVEEEKMNRKVEELEAFIQGEKDYKKCGGVADSDPITEFFSPSYTPPSNPKLKEFYDKGWDNAKKQ